MKSRPVLITYSILAGLHVLTGGAMLSDTIGMKAAGLLTLGIAAVEAGMSFYVQGTVTPAQDVAAFVDHTGKMVAGAASGTSRGAGVAVVPTDPNVSAEQVRAAQLLAAKVTAARKRK